MKLLLPARGAGAIDAMVEVRSTRTKIAPIDDGPAMRNVGVVVVTYSSAAAPIVSPMGPTPAEAAKESDSESHSKTDPRTVPKESRIRIPTGEDRQRIAVHQPGIVLRH